MKNDVPFNVLANPNSWERSPRGPLAAAIGGALGFSTTTLFGGAAISLFGGAVVISTASVVGSLVLWAVTSWATKAMSPKFDTGAFESQGLLVNAREAAGPQHFVYGEVRKGGTVSFYETTGTDNKFLHQIIVLAGHEINSIQQIYINDENVTLDSNGFVTGDRWNSKIRIYYHLGNQTSSTSAFANVSSKNLSNTLLADSELTGDDALDSNFVGKGLAYLYVRHEYDREVFANGIPTITAQIRGKKIFDPREASHVSNDPSTWAYSDNAALCIRDFISSEYGLGDDKIDDTSFAAAANECDEDVTIYDSTTEKRYTINGVVDASRPVGGVLEDMVPACAGTLFYGAGKWMLKAGAYTTPVKTFTDDDFRSSVNLDTKVSFRDTFNAVQGTYPSKDNDYITSDYPKISDATYLSADNNEESILDLPLNYTTSTYTAQRLAKLTLLRGRQQMTFTADFGTEAMEVEVGDIVQITHDRYSFSAKLFEVITWQMAVSDSGGLVVRMTLRETAQSAFAWNTSDATAATVKATVVPSVTDTATIGQVTATNTGFVDGDGTFVSRVTLDWPDVVGGNFSHYEVDHKLSTDSQYKTIITPVSLVNLSDYKKDDVVNYRLRTVNTLGATSDYTTVGSITVTGDTTAPSAPTSVSATGSFRAASIEWTNPDVVDFSHAEVYRSTTNDNTSATKIAEVSSNSYVDAPLANSTTYYYWVKAVDYSDNASGFSSSASATTTLIEGSDIPSNTITETMISDDSISTAKIQANAISANELAADSVTSGKIEAGAVTAAKIAADAITADKISTNTLSAISADLGTITGGNLALGNLAVDSTNMEPTSGAGVIMENDGDVAFGGQGQYVAFDASTGKILVAGEIVNLTQDALAGRDSGTYSVITASETLTNNLSGAGFYSFVMVGGGGGGSGLDTDESGQGSGGGSSGICRFSFKWDGSTALSFTRGTGGTGGAGNSGTASTFTYGNLTLATANGGGGANNVNSANQQSGGAAGTASISNNVVTLLFSYAADGKRGSNAASGGGAGIDFLDPTNEAPNATAAITNNSKSGGGMGTNQLNAHSGSNVDDTTPTDNNAVNFNFMGLQVTNSFRGGNISIRNSDAGPTAQGGAGGPFCGGGGARGNQNSVAAGGAGGYGGGGGGHMDDVGGGNGGAGGNGALYWKKL